MEAVTIGNPVNSWLLIQTTLILQDISLRTCMSDVARPPLVPMSMSWVAALLALTFCKSRIYHAHVSQEKLEKFQVGYLNDNNLLVVSEESVVVAQDKQNMDDKEDSTVIFDFVHLSHTQEFCNEDLYSKVLDKVPYFVQNSKESTMMMEQNIWCENLSSPTLHEGMLSDKT